MLYRYASGDDIRPRPVTAVPSGTHEVTLVAYRVMSSTSRPPPTPSGGSYAQTGGVVEAPGIWLAAEFADRATVFPNAGSGVVYASITTFRVATGGTWTEAPGTRWFRFGTLKWTELATTGNILGLRVGRNDRDNNDNLSLLQRIRAGSRIQLSTGTRLIRGSVLATFAYPDADAPSGVDIEFEVRGKRDGGDRSDWPIDPQDAELCILDGPLKEELDRSTARLLKDSIGDNADVLREPIAEALAPEGQPATLIPERVYWQGTAAGQTTTMVPRSQTLTLPAASSFNSDSVIWSGQSISVDSAFIEDGHADAVLNFFQITSGTSTRRIELRLNPGSREFTDQMEGNWTLIVGFGGQTWEFDHADFSSDPTEPYRWVTTDATVIAA